jgi:hypothetical protein
MAFKSGFIVLICLLHFGCYSFKGISIPPTISTFYIDQFQNSAFNAPPDIGIQFTEGLRDIVLNSSRLSYDEVSPDIEFQGSVRSFLVSSVAPQETDLGVGSALNRLQISVEVEYINNQNEEDTWKQSFSFFQDFESTTDLNSVQDELIGAIFDQIIQDIFNKAFTNW